MNHRLVIYASAALFLSLQAAEKPGQLANMPGAANTYTSKMALLKQADTKGYCRRIELLNQELQKTTDRAHKADLETHISLLAFKLFQGMSPAARAQLKLLLETQDTPDTRILDTQAKSQQKKSATRQNDPFGLLFIE